MLTQDTTQKIQSIINQYRALGWTDVRPLDMGGNRLPRIVCWSPCDTFSIHIELHQAKEVAHYVSIFTTADNGAVAGFWHKGHDIMPPEVEVIIGIVTGELAKRFRLSPAYLEAAKEAIEENTEALAPVEEK
jgi:hypothetical protein